MERNQSSALVRLSSCSLRLSFAFGVVGVFASVGSAASTSKDTYYVNDHLATTVATSDASGEIAQIEADAFGTQTGPVAKDARFTGKPYDADIGAYVFPFRNYRSGEARWMSADPSGFPDGINNAHYSPNPLNEIDVYGLRSAVVERAYWYYIEASANNLTLIGSALGGVIGVDLSKGQLKVGAVVTAAILTFGGGFNFTSSLVFNSPYYEDVDDSFNHFSTSSTPKELSYVSTSVDLMTTTVKFKKSWKATYT